MMQCCKMHILNTQGWNVAKSWKVRCLEQDLSETLSISIVLVFLGTKFCEFSEY